MVPFSGSQQADQIAPTNAPTLGSDLIQMIPQALGSRRCKI
jgi:hypothetical protein